MGPTGWNGESRGGKSNEFVMPSSHSSFYFLCLFFHPYFLMVQMCWMDKVKKNGIGCEAVNMVFDEEMKRTS